MQVCNLFVVLECDKHSLTNSTAKICWHKGDIHKTVYQLRLNKQLKNSNHNLKRVTNVNCITLDNPREF